MNLKVSDAKREEGFTLIELLVVVIIIGILAAIAIPVFLNQRAQAWERTAQSDARNAAIALESYFNDEFEYPAVTDLAGLSADPPVAVTIEGETITPSPGVAMEYSLGNSSASASNDIFWVCVTHDNISEDDFVAIYKSGEGGLDQDVDRNNLDTGACTVTAP